MFPRSSPNRNMSIWRPFLEEVKNFLFGQLGLLSTERDRIILVRVNRCMSKDPLVIIEEQLTSYLRTILTCSNMVLFFSFCSLLIDFIVNCCKWFIWFILLFSYWEGDLCHIKSFGNIWLTLDLTMLKISLSDVLYSKLINILDRKIWISKTRKNVHHQYQHLYNFSLWFWLCEFYFHWTNNNNHLYILFI